jgi:hypothetical protein
MALADVQSLLLDHVLQALLACDLIDPATPSYRHPCEPVAVCDAGGALISWWRPMTLDRTASGCPGPPVALISIRWVKCWPADYQPQQALDGSIYVSLTPAVADLVAVETADIAEAGFLALRQLECQGATSSAWPVNCRGIKVGQAGPVCPGIFYGVQWDVTVMLDPSGPCPNAAS